jgi:uncharacterized protein (DUF983 family)
MIDVIENACPHCPKGRMKKTQKDGRIIEVCDKCGHTTETENL